MKILNYKDSKKIFDDILFKNELSKLLVTLAYNPHRFIGDFRVTDSKLKIIQNLTQSREIKFGKAFEEYISEIFAMCGFTKLETNLKQNGESLHIDHLLEKNKKIILIEQKMRDDHDSSNKKGQFSKFQNKIKVVNKNNPNVEINCFFYFVDPASKKNKNFYENAIVEFKNKNPNLNNISVNLCYGSEIFQKMKLDKVWECEISPFLKKYTKSTRDLKISFDIEEEHEKTEIYNIKPIVFEKIFENQKIVKEILPIIFPKDYSLNNLIEIFKIKSKNNTKTSFRYENLIKEVIQIKEKRHNSRIKNKSLQP